MEISHWFLYLLPEPELNLHWPTDVGLSVASVGIFLKIEQRVLLGWRSCQKSVIEVVGLSKAAKAHWPAVLYCVVRVIFLNHFRAVEDWYQYCFLMQLFQSSCPNVQSGLKITFASYHQLIWRVVDTKSALKQLTSTGMAPGRSHIPLSFFLPPENFGHQIETLACGTIFFYSREHSLHFKMPSNTRCDVNEV